MNAVVIYILIAIGAFLVFSYYTREFTGSKDIKYDEFIEMLDDNEVSEVTITNSYIYITSNKDNKEKTFKTVNIGDDSLIEKLEAKSKEGDLSFKGDIDKSTPILNFVLTIILPLGLIFLMYKFLFSKAGGLGGGGMMGIGKNNAKFYVENEIKVTFDDVAGQEEAKESLKEVIDFLNCPKKYTEIGAKLPKGVLLVGPPGTGKTLIARAVAGEARVPFFSLSGSSFVEMFVGVGASRVRELFKDAVAKAPCIVFIDEIDAIGKSRDSQMQSNDEREQTLNQLLSEMDGFDSSKGVVLLGATNRPEILDKALLRPGRFDRRVIVDRPDFKGREAILKVHAKKVILGTDVDLSEIAKSTPGAVGADLANIINEAALRAVRRRRKEVLQEDLREAVEVIIAGKEKKDRILSPKERKVVAFHEVGHALVAAMLKGTDPVHKITIVPRTMGALGYTMQLPEEEKYLTSKEELLNQITVMLGGRSAEEEVFNLVSTGASNDIEKATQSARSMVSMYGMSEEFDMTALESIQNRYLDGRAVRNCSEETSTQLDRQTIKIIKQAHKRARDILRENRDLLDKIASILLEKETMFGDEFFGYVYEKYPELKEEKEKEQRQHEKEVEELKKDREEKRKEKEVNEQEYEYEYEKRNKERELEIEELKREIDGDVSLKNMNDDIEKENKVNDPYSAKRKLFADEPLLFPIKDKTDSEEETVKDDTKSDNSDDNNDKNND
ncbi:ATP-dependent zinc metalloprotease FtsH [Clostridium sp. BJN0001]|uniref:ATP-dependent zinc metalloprotease FtsH n=1 Tax=Clostridium sp. BJN0001 TaxID=2930219 RepID=UPI001FCFFD7B|nr:ATP-dependent zinc metalloprotease FtsH [Clostridium sp. BJN0001]